METKMLKRCVLSALAFAMSVSMIQFRPVIATEKVETITDAQILINNYDLVGEPEADVLLHNAINKTVYSFVAPTSSSLVSVNTDNKTVTAETYNDEAGNQWVPEEAVITEGETVKTVKFDGKKASFEVTGDNYNVEVVYRTYKVIDKATQLNLVNTPDSLKNATDALEAIYRASNDLANVTTYIPTIYAAVEAAGDAVDATVKGAIKDLYNQIKDDAEGEEAFDLNDLANEFNKNYSFEPVSYLFTEKVDTLLAAAKDMQEDLDIVANTSYASTTAKRHLTRVLNSLTNAVDAKNWTVLDNESIDGSKVDVDLEDAVYVVDGYGLEAEDIKANLILAEATVEVPVNLFTVTVNYVANVAVGEPLTASKEVKFPLGTTKEAIIAAITEAGYETEVLAGWQANQVGTEFYTRSEEGLEATLTEDATYTITYVPNTYKLTVVGEDGKEIEVISGLYGEIITLASAEEGQYEYVIGTETLSQGREYTIVGDVTITRKTVDKEIFRLFDVIAEDTAYGLNKYTKDILTHAALLSPTASYNVYDQTKVDSATAIAWDEELSAYVLTAPTYDAGIPGMEWKPVSYLINGKGEAVAFAAGETNAVLNTTEVVKNVTVNYELRVSKNSSTGTIINVDEKLGYYINLPATLIAETADQVARLQQLVDMAQPDGYLTMGSVVSTGLTTLKGIILSNNGDAAPTPGHKDYEEYQAIVRLTKECLDTDGNLHVYNYIKEYMKPEKGLVEYYNGTYNYKAYMDQLDILVECLEIIQNCEELGELQNDASLPAEIREKIGQIKEIYQTIADIELVAPNAIIDVNSDKLAGLLSMLQNADYAANVQTIESTANGLRDYAAINVTNNETSADVTVTVTVNGVTTTTTTSANKNGFTQDDIDALKDIVAKAEEYADTKHYERAEIEWPNVGDSVANFELKVEWTPVEYTVTVPGAADTTVTYGDTGFKLPAPTSTEFYYIYNVNGLSVTVKAGKDVNFPIGKPDFDTFFNENRELVVTVETIYVEEENKDYFVNYVEDFNEVFAGLNTQFVLIENNGSYELVLRVDPSEVGALKGRMNAIAKQLVMNNDGYKYIALGTKENALWAQSSEVSELSIQAMLNTLLYSKLSDKTLHELTDANGNVKDLTLNGTAVVGENANLGGLVLDTDLFLGTVGNITQTVPFYVTLGVDGGLAKFDKFMELIKPYIQFNTVGYELNVTFTMPDKAYQVLLAGMIALGYADLDKLDEVKFAELINYVEKQYLLTEELSTEVLQNTLDMLGVDRDITQYSKYIDFVFTALDQISFAKEAVGSNSVDGVYTGNIAAIKKVLSALNLDGVYLQMIKETSHNTDITLPVNVTLSNIGTTYDAIVVDAFNENKAVYNRIGFSKDIVKDMPKLDDRAVVVLLKDVEGTLSINNNTILDLNGNDVNMLFADPAANVKVFDSAFQDGTVGLFSAKNAQLAGGIYDQDVTKYVVDGFKQFADGTVAPKYYRFYEQTVGETTQIVLEVNPDIKGLTKAQLKEDLNITYLGLDLALTLGMKYYNTSSLTIDEKQIFGLNDTFADFVGILANDSRHELLNKFVDIAKWEGIAAFTNQVYAELTDFAALADSIGNGGVIAEYDVVTSPVIAGFDVKTQNGKDYLTGGIYTNTDLEVKDTFVVKFNEDTVNTPSLSAVLDVLADVLKVNRDADGNFVPFITLTDVEVFFSDKDIKTDLAGNVAVDITFNSPKYTVLMATVFAYGVKDNTALVNGLKDYICTGEKAGLVKAINKLTVADMYNAVTKASKTDGITFADMADAIGLDITDYEGASTVEEIVDAYLRAAMIVMNKLGVSDSTRKFSFELVNGQYVDSYSMNKLNGRAKASLTINLFADVEHTHIYTTTTVAPTCTDKGYDLHTCTICGESYKDNYVDALGHNFGAWYTYKAATCTEQGIERRECSVCGHYEERLTDVVEHEYEAVVTAPTCTEQGYTTYTCKHCGATYVADYVDALGHNIIIINAKEATYDHDGYTGDKYCTICNKIIEYGEVIPRLVRPEEPDTPSTSDYYFVGLYATICMLCLAILVVLKKKSELNEQ